MNGNKQIYAKFNGPEIFLEQGRLLFSLLHIFSSSGYQVYLFNNLDNDLLDKYGQMVYTINNLFLTEKVPEQPEIFFYLYDKADKACITLPWQKKIQIRFDLFSPFWFSNPIIMPFPMHPLQSGITLDELKKYQTSERKIRIFFSGDTQNYGRVWVRYPQPKLPRLQVINTIHQRLNDELIVVHHSAELESLYRNAYTNKCVLTASSEIRIEPGDWLATLARAEFFLSPPGIVMPMCHNIIEAMAVGTIPVTNYPEWLDPHLRHLENCIAFTDGDDLIAKLKLALAMDPTEMARLRTNVLSYYNTYLRPETFVNRIETSTDHRIPVLMYTERNMAKNPKKLGRHSILMQNTATPREKNGLKRIASSYLKLRPWSTSCS